jgi:hypothetical protein
MASQVALLLCANNSLCLVGVIVDYHRVVHLAVSVRDLVNDDRDTFISVQIKFLAVSSMPSVQ